MTHVTRREWQQRTARAWRWEGWAVVEAPARADGARALLKGLRGLVLELGHREQLLGYSFFS